MSRKRKTSVAGFVGLAECPIGLFLCAGELCLKTEYSTNDGRIEAYIVSSGEHFGGDAPQTVAAQRATRVQPVTVLHVEVSGARSAEGAAK